MARVASQTCCFTKNYIFALKLKSEKMDGQMLLRDAASWNAIWCDAMQAMRCDAMQCNAIRYVIFNTIVFNMC